MVKNPVKKNYNSSCQSENFTVIYLHKHSHFKHLIERVSEDMGISVSLIEKDYWIMHVLYSLNKVFNFQMKGGTSLSKGFKIIDRFSEDIDIQIKPPETKLNFRVYYGKNYDKIKHIESRKKYFEWIKCYLDGKINGIEEVKRDNAFDDSKYRNAGIRLYYKSHFSSPLDIKEGILLELGFDKVTPNTNKNISSWIFDRSELKSIKDNTAKGIVCYNPEYTFIEKLDAVVRKYKKYQDTNNFSENFLRHYYDLYCLLGEVKIQNFIGTKLYESYKKERMRKLSQTIKNHSAFSLKNLKERALFEKEYKKQKNLYYKGQIPFKIILKKLSKYSEKF